MRKTRKASTILAEKVEEYRWSSGKAHLTGEDDPLLTGVPWLDPLERKAFADFMHESAEETDNAIRKASRAGRLFGSESFIDRLEYQLNQSLRPKKPGRPRKKDGECPRECP